MEEALNMWEEYIQEARSNACKLKERAIEIKYEDLLIDHVRVLGSVANFCELPVSDSDIETAVNSANNAMLYAFLSDPELAAFADNVPEWLKVLRC
jgi:hypothetical protein